MDLIDCSQRFRFVCCYGDVDFLCAGKAQSLVYFCFRTGLWVGFNLWLLTGSMAVWRRGGCVVGGGAEALVAGAVSGNDSFLKSRLTRQFGRLLLEWSATQRGEKDAETIGDLICGGVPVCKLGEGFCAGAIPGETEIRSGR